MKNSSKSCWSSSVNSSGREASSVDWGGMAAESGRETAGRETAGREAAGDEEANVEDGREEEMKTGTGGNEDTHGGTAAGRGTGGPSGDRRLDGRLRDSQCLNDSSTDRATIISSSMAVLSEDMN